MSQPYLEVTFRGGRPFAAYDYVAGRPGRKSARTRRIEPGLVVDFAKGGEPIGVQITAPGAIKFGDLNKVLKELGVPPLTRAEFEPLRVAS